MEYQRQLSIIIIATITLLVIVSQVQSSPLSATRYHHSIRKRTILQMCGLITLQTGRSCLDYNRYGCFCGLGNQGTKPLDRTDLCCRKHDSCYGDVSCFWFYPQWVGYNIDCNGTECQCTDSPDYTPCAYSTCRCDLRLAECLGEANFHDYYRDYNRQLCNHRVVEDDHVQSIDNDDDDGNNNSNNDDNNNNNSNNDDNNNNNNSNNDDDNNNSNNDDNNNNNSNNDDDNNNNSNNDDNNNNNNSNNDDDNNNNSNNDEDDDDQQDNGTRGRSTLESGHR